MTDAELMKSKRADLDIGQSEMAELMGYSSYHMISYVENGHRNLSPSARKLLNIIGK